MRVMFYEDGELRLVEAYMVSVGAPSGGKPVLVAVRCRVHEKVDDDAQHLEEFIRLYPDPSWTLSEVESTIRTYVGSLTIDLCCLAFPNGEGRDAARE